ncbi:unnamed protein product, partial [Rotaria sordida]
SSHLSSITFSHSNSIPTEPSQSSIFLKTISSTTHNGSSSHTRQYTSERIKFLLKQQSTTYVVIKNENRNTPLWRKGFGFPTKKSENSGEL